MSAYDIGAHQPEPTGTDDTGSAEQRGVLWELQNESRTRDNQHDTDRYSKRLYAQPIVYRKLPSRGRQLDFARIDASKFIPARAEAEKMALEYRLALKFDVSPASPDLAGLKERKTGLNLRARISEIDLASDSNPPSNVEM